MNRSHSAAPAPTFRLWLMMVLEFAIWGAWLPLIWGYMGKDGLNFSDPQIAWVGSAFAIASIVGIFFSSQFADRTFSAERFMAFSHLVGGLAILAMYWAREIAAASGLGVFTVFFGLMLVHALLYVPTISVSNSIAFTHMKNAQKEFGIVRMGGTIGWILAAWPLFFLLKGKEGIDAVNASRGIFLVSGVTSLALAAYSLFLPHTPPKRAEGKTSIAWLRATGFLSYPYLLVLFVVTFIDSVIHNGYFKLAENFLEKGVGLEKAWIMPVMSIGQVAEILTMAVLGGVLARLGWKTTMILGILGHAARFGVFALLPQNTAVIIAVQVLHGICYAFFFATLYIFIDAAFPKDVRASAQSLFNLLVLGLGDLAANWFFFPLRTSLTSADGVVDYRRLFLVPTFLALAAAALLLIAFWPPKSLATAAETEDDLETEPQAIT
ncbi:MAG: MFS transporter [Planctomycetaceae bacterium]